MSTKIEKPKLKTPITVGEFYWVRIDKHYDFEPAKCKDRYGDGILYFYFTDGSVKEVKNVWDVEPLNR